MKKTVQLSSIIAIIGLTGCGVSELYFRDQNPVIQDSLWLDGSADHITATKAGHRLAYIHPNNGEYICAEPLPDVAETFNSAVLDAIKLTLQGQAPVGIENTYSRDISTQVAPLLYRTQGLQLYRNAMHELCMKKLNHGEMEKINQVSSSNKSESTGAKNSNPFNFKPLSMQQETVTKTTTGDGNTVTTVTEKPKEYPSAIAGYVLKDDHIDYERYYFDKAADVIKEEIKQVMVHLYDKNPPVEKPVRSSLRV